MSSCKIWKTVVLCALLCVDGTICEESQMFPASTEQMEELAAVLYTYFDYGSMHVTEEQCKKAFFDSSSDGSIQPSKVLEVNTSMRMATFSVTPSQYPQLVVMMPKENNNEILENIVIDPGSNVGSLETKPGDYTTWVQGFDAYCNHSIWFKGPNFTLHEEKYEHKLYRVQLDFQKNMTDDLTPAITGLFTWNSSDDTDNKFYVINTCQGKIVGDIFIRTIWGNRSVTIDNLLVNDECMLKIEGKYGVTEFRYNTPSCEEIPHCVPDPEVPQITLIEATDTWDGNWDVHVEWLKPKREPSAYNITVYADQEVNKTVAGNTTEVTLRNVSGVGVYEVLILAISTNGKVAFNTTRAMFPPVSLHQDSMSIIITGMSCGVAICVMIPGLIYWRKRYLKKRLLYPSTDEWMTAKYLSAESWGAEPVIEDGWEVAPESLRLHEVVGEGAFGVVRRGLLAGREVAVKMLKEFPSREEVRWFRAEMELMKSVGAHPHVVTLLGVCSRARPLLVAEYCARGDLLSYLRCFADNLASKQSAKYYNTTDTTDDFAKTILLQNEQNGKFVVNKMYDIQGVCDVELTPLDLLSFCRQIAKGMEFLAANRVVHRDLAARNVLVSGDRTLKIADFGLSRDVYQNNMYKMENPGKMPVKWMAIESLTKRIYTTKSDVWSFGVVVWEVATVGGAPYSDVSPAALPALLLAGHRLPRPRSCSPLLYEVMQSCWRARAHERPTFSELLARIDRLLEDACAGRYITLELAEEAPPQPPLPAPSYLHMLLAKTQLAWSRTQIYMKSHFGQNYNHYTSTPVTLSPPQIA